MLSHTYRRAAKRIGTLLTGGNMNRSYEQGRANMMPKQALTLFAPARLAVIAVIIAVLAAGAMLAPALRADARPLGEKAGPSAGSTVAGSTVAGAAGNAVGDNKGRPLAEMLNPDGTMNLRTGFSGSVDMAGWGDGGGPGGGAPLL